MRIGINAGYCACTIVLSGCTQLHPTVSAEPLDPTLISAEPTPGDDTVNLLFKVTNDSEFKCGAFIDRLTIGQNGVNTAGDLLSGLLSGLATIFTPLSTTHALSGAATIITGGKTAIDSDYWAKSGPADYALAIQNTYYTQLKSYRTELTTAPSTYKFQNGVGVIQSIHDQCKLGAAEATIKASLSGAGPPPAVPAVPGVPAAAVVPAVPGVPGQGHPVAPLGIGSQGARGILNGGFTPGGPVSSTAH